MGSDRGIIYECRRGVIGTVDVMSTENSVAVALRAHKSNGNESGEESCENRHVEVIAGRM